MCVTEKCCFFVPINKGAIFIGIICFVMSAFLATISIVLYTQENHLEQEYSTYKLVFKEKLGLGLHFGAINVILFIIWFFGLLGMLASILLIIGVYKNKTSFVLFFFTIAIIIDIINLLGGILVLIHNAWELAGVMIVISLIYTHFIVVIYNVYDLMSNGIDLGFNQRQLSDEDLLVDLDYNSNDESLVLRVID